MVGVAAFAGCVGVAGIVVGAATAGSPCFAGMALIGVVVVALSAVVVPVVTVACGVKYVGTAATVASGGGAGGNVVLSVGVGLDG